MKELPDYVPFQSQARPPLRSIFTAASDDALDLLDRMLTFNPAKRITAKEALEHFYFKSEPHPTEPTKLPRPMPKTTAKGVAGIQPKKLKF
jgi:cyclin-dependent kinase 7